MKSLLIPLICLMLGGCIVTPGYYSAGYVGPAYDGPGYYSGPGYYAGPGYSYGPSYYDGPRYYPPLSQGFNTFLYDRQRPHYGHWNQHDEHHNQGHFHGNSGSHGTHSH